MLDTLPVSVLARYLDKALPKGWEELELETILLEIGTVASYLLADKINVIRAIRAKPELFYENPLFFLHSCEVISNQVADFDFVPSLTSLEAALGIVDVAKLLGLTTVEECPPFGEGVQEVVKEILINDGYTSAVWPFDSVGIGSLARSDTPGFDAGATVNKAKAIRDYIHGTYSKSIS